VGLLHANQWLQWSTADWTHRLVQYHKLSTTDIAQWPLSTQQNMVNSFQNYQSQGFIELIKGLPNFQDCIFNLYKECKNESTRQAFFNKVYDICNTANIAQIEKQIEDLAHPLMIDRYTGQFDPSIPYRNYYHLDSNQLRSYIEPNLETCTIVVQQSPNPLYIEQTRPLIPAIKQDITTHYNSQAILEQTGSLPEEITTVEQMHVNLQTSAIKQVVSDQAQNRDFKICKNIVSGDAAGKLFYELFATVNTSSVEHCNKGYLAKGLILNELSFEMYQFITAIGRGIYAGAKQVVSIARQHPIGTVCWIVAPKYMLAFEIGCHFGKVLYAVGGFAKTALFNPESVPVHLQSAWNNVPTIHSLDSLIHNTTAELKQMSRYEIAEQSVQYATQLALSHRLFKGIEKFTLSAKGFARANITKFTPPKLKAASQQLSHFAQGTQQKLKQLTQNVARPIKVNNMAEFLRDTEFGKELKNKVTHIGKSWDGQAIYQLNEKIKKYGLQFGDYLYLDKLHKDHLEVFTQKKKLRCVLNLNGTINNIKTNQIPRRILDI